MIFRTHASAIYHCPLERAFKTPMLCDVTRVHTGMGPMPRIVGTSDEHNWGQPGGTKKAYAAKSFMQKGGFVSMDRVVERIENTYWKIEVYDFQAWFFGFYKFVGEWRTTEIAEHTIQIDYDYTLYANSRWFYPLNWWFAKVFWKRYMKQVLENVRKLAEGNEPYQYD